MSQYRIQIGPVFCRL